MRHLMPAILLSLGACASTPPPAPVATSAPQPLAAPVAAAQATPVSVPSPTAAQVPDADMDKAPGSLDGSGRIELPNTYWKLLAIEESVVPLRPGYRESHLRLIGGSNRFTGQGICSRIGGGYEIEGDKLHLEVIDSMPSACWPDGVPESTLVDAINDTATFKIEGNDLFLIDADGVRRAHFQAQVRVGVRGEVIERMADPANP